jgi:hypothetical protein
MGKTVNVLDVSNLSESYEIHYGVWYGEYPEKLKNTLVFRVSHIFITCITHTFSFLVSQNLKP